MQTLFITLAGALIAIAGGFLVEADHVLPGVIALITGGLLFLAGGFLE